MARLHQSYSRRIALIAAMLALPLAGCGETGSGPVRSAGSRPPPRASGLTAVRPPVRHVPPAPVTLQTAPGLERVIGATSADLTRQFGTARLDVWEGDARKLQFTGNACVLDVYLYPLAQGREPQATYVDARRASDGRDTDRAGCVEALRRR